MGRKCCVPESKSGYASVAKAAAASTEDSAESETSEPDKISFHGFPKNETVKQMWIRSIPRKD